MKTFYQTFHCLSQTHCGACRAQTEEGRKWRESIAENFSVPQVDFDCPQGKPWNYQPEKSRGLGDTMAKAIHKVSRGRIIPCNGCKKRQAMLNKRFPYKQKESITINQ